MKQRRIALTLLLLPLLLLALTTACKSSGMAVTKKGQLLKINITGAADLPEGGTDEMVVQVSNRGVNKINGVEFEVEIPGEIVVVSEVHGDGMQMTESRSSSGNRMFHYSVGDIEAGNESTARFHVRTSFGAMTQSGDVTVRAWAADLPGNSDKLMEKKFIKLRK